MAETTAEKNKLTVTILSDREVMLERTFNAPRRLVFEAHSKPEHIRQWWGMSGTTMPVCEMDFRPGGEWRYVLRDPAGNEYPFKGIYREIVEPERLGWTFIFDVEPYSIHESIETMEFMEQEGRTTIKVTTLYESLEVRDAVLASGMEGGAADTYNRLDEYLVTMG